MLLDKQLFDSVVMTAGGDSPGVVVEQGRYHSLEATNEMGVIMEAKAHKYHPFKTENILNPIKYEK